MFRLSRNLIAAGLVLVALPSTAQTQDTHSIPAISISGDGPETVVLLSGLVGGVAGYRRLEARLLAQHRRVVIIDSYLLSIDSTDVSYAAQARRVDRVLDSLGVTDAQVVGHGHGAGVALRIAASAPQRVRALYFLDVGALPDHRSAVFSASPHSSRGSRVGKASFAADSCAPSTKAAGQTRGSTPRPSERTRTRCSRGLTGPSRSRFAFAEPASRSH